MPEPFHAHALTSDRYFLTDTAQLPDLQLQTRSWFATDLAVCGLRVQRGDLLLTQPLSVSVTAGQIVHLLGRNGAGKSTFLQQLAGLLPYADHDMLRWGGAGAADWPVLYMGHKAGLSSLLSVRANLAFLQGIHRLDERAVSNALAHVGLLGYEHTPVAELSSGQKRRVSLARLWMAGQDAPLWLLDEPLTALDQTMAAQVCARLAEYAAGGGRVILTSHQPLSIAVTPFNLDDYALDRAEIARVGGY